VPTISVGLSAGDFGGGDQAPSRFGHFAGRTDVDVIAVWSVQNLGFGNRALRNKARAEIGQADAQRAQTIDLVRREVAEALTQANAARRQMELAEKRVATAQQAFRQDLTRAKNLQGRLIEVLDSLSLLTAARRDLVSQMVSFSQAQFGLYVALGA
jgi:outer membrane protein TolC